MGTYVVPLSPPNAKIKSFEMNATRFQVCFPELKMTLGS